MIVARTDRGALEARAPEVASEVRHQRWNAWPVNWTAIWIGALASLAAILVFGLIGLALGAHLLDPENRWVELRKLSIGALVFSVCGAFFAFVIGGWVTTKVAAILHAEPAMLHGAISWLLTVPLLIVMMALGAGNFFGGWYAGLAGTPTWAPAAVAPYDRPEPLSAAATEAERAAFRADVAAYQQKVRQWREDTPKVTRNSALGALTALLLGLVGSVVGGWFASGEPMNFNYYRTRTVVREHV